jgi:hypothetical protein
MEQFANNASSTLASGINDTVGTLDVVSAALFPTSGNFRLLIGTELFLVTGVSGTTFTVATPRGKEGTTAASHLAGATVTLVLTSGAMDQFKTDTKNPIESTPPQITADQDDYDPTGGDGTSFSVAEVLRLSSDAARNITGFVASVSHTVKTLINVGTQDIVLNHDNAASVAANRVYTPNGSPYRILAGWTTRIVYDFTSSRWRVVDSSAGAQGFSFQYIAVAGVTFTSLATWTRVGTVRIDPVQLGTSTSYLFRAWLDRSVTGITVECQLYNLTDGGVVAGSGLSFGPPDTDLGPKEFEASVALAHAIKDYEVQFRLTVDSGGVDQGGISRADILVTFTSGSSPNPVRAIVPTTISYLVQPTDDLIEIGTLSTPINITLPAAPSTGETHEVKDGGGTLTTYNATVLGNGHNIDGSSSFVMRVSYATFKFTYDGTKWLIL